MEIIFNTKILKWALKQRAQNAIQLQKKFPKLGDWLEERGKKPTYNQLVQLSNFLYIPFGYFFLSNPPDISSPIPHFRTVNEKEEFQPSPDILETIEIVSRRQEWLRDYLIELGNSPLEFVGSVTTKSNINQVSQQIREKFKLPSLWANMFRTWSEAYLHLIKQVEDVGIYVVINGIVGNNTHRRLDVKEFRGFALSDEYAPFIFINGQDAKSAQMFTFAHELVHIWLGKSASFDLRELQPANTELELFCNHVAVEFLVPEHELKRLWPQIKDATDVYQKIARHFKVSEIVGARRMQDLGLITKEQFSRFYEDYIQKEFKKSKTAGGDFYNTQPYRISRRFAQIVYTAVRNEKLLYREAYKLTGLYGKTFDNFIKKKRLLNRCHL
jgi:Zn-dependent peptidase ImmA (M78 family)